MSAEIIDLAFERQYRAWQAAGNVIPLPQRAADFIDNGMAWAAYERGVPFSDGRDVDWPADTEPA